MEEEIKKLTGSFYDDDLKNTLLIEGEKLKKAAQEAIEKLKKEGKAKLAEGLEAVEKRVLDIDAQVRALNPTTEIGKGCFGSFGRFVEEGRDRFGSRDQEIVWHILR